MRKTKLCGSATVEAAFVVPIVLFAIFAIIVFCFYMCDRIRLANDLSLLNEHLREEYCITRTIDKDEAGKWLRKQLDRGYIICTPDETIDYASDTKLEVTVSLKLKRMPIGMLQRYLEAMKVFTFHRTIDVQDRETVARVLGSTFRMLDKGGQ